MNGGAPELPPDRAGLRPDERAVNVRIPAGATELQQRRPVNEDQHGAHQFAIIRKISKGSHAKNAERKNGT